MEEQFCHKQWRSFTSTAIILYGPIIMPRRWLTGSIRLCRGVIWFTVTSNVHWPILIWYMCLRRRRRRQTVKKSKRPDPDRLAAIFIQNKINPFSAVHDQCWSRQEIAFIRDCGCSVYSHNFLVTWCTTVVDKEVMSCMLHPVCVIGLEWQTSTVLMCAVSSVGEGSLQDVAMESQIRAHIRAGGRQSKYSNGGRELIVYRRKKSKGNSSCQLRLRSQSQVVVLPMAN